MANQTHNDITFVLGEDEITGDDEIAARVVLSCGHTAAPESVIQWCWTQLDQGKNRFSCPVATDTGETCDIEWPYNEIRNIALKIDADMTQCEETLACRTAKKSCEIKQCPGCLTHVERKNIKNLQVCCTICTGKNGKSYTFCWQCLKPWKGGNTSSVRCSNEGCKDPRLDILQNCKLIDLPSSNIKKCPSTRACTTCGFLIEHKAYCKYILCTQCGTRFCFVCLETAKNCKQTKKNASYMMCFKPMAPRQTLMPEWSMQNVHTQPNSAVNVDAVVPMRLQPQLQQPLLLLPQPHLQHLPQQPGQQQLPQLPGQPELLQQLIKPPLRPKPVLKMGKQPDQQDRLQETDKQQLPQQPAQQPLAQKGEKQLFKQTGMKEFMQKLQELTLRPDQQQHQQQLVRQPAQQQQPQLVKQPDQQQHLPKIVKQPDQQQHQQPLLKQIAQPSFMQELHNRLKNIPGSQIQ